MERRNNLKRGLLLFAALAVPILFVACKKTPKPAPVVKTVRVLFVGNSLTYMNDLPGLIASLAKARNIDMQYEMYAPGGYTLAQHAGDPQLQQKIQQGIWDFVVLQEQSQIPAFPWVTTQVFPYARQLSLAARNANPGVKVAFYATMARKNGDASNAKSFPELATYEGMQKKLDEAYARMALDNGGILVPVGAVWAKLRAQEPALDLYLDDVHPNAAGTYLAACVFYAALFGDDPAGLPHPPQMDDNTAASMQRLANAAGRPAQPPL